MRKKNWIEFENEEQINNNNVLNKNPAKSKKINIHKEKKGKRGKIITVISGISKDNSYEYLKLFKNLKIFCGTGGKLNDESIQLQGDMEEKVKIFLRKEGYQI